MATQKEDQEWSHVSRYILQYFRPSLSYHLSLRYLFCLILSGRLRLVLLYAHYLRLRHHYKTITIYFNPYHSVGLSILHLYEFSINFSMNVPKPLTKTSSTVLFATNSQDYVTNVIVCLAYSGAGQFISHMCQM